ncbi:unnamed protein product [Rotaria magnacalcarata]|uniref:Uncharacterized protein n=1 Tax=Rotaria magnacalcarata TaxID=392030 RepID=A0A819V6N0_9BILA|nr:unnamed protein product [Rotaria magnacalcarata]CAF4104387.1 unnamed protein product [Rotaria magnacalcarata]
MAVSTTHIRMKDSYSSSIPPTPAPRKCRSAQQHGIDQNKIRLPRLIPYSTLHDNIIWLDLFVNERNLTFAKDMIAANRLLVFNAASDCIDFLGSCRQQCSLTTMRDIYSVIISGVYATNIQVIDQLLKYDIVDQICLIVNECCYENLHGLCSLNHRVSVIYNESPDRVMCHLCDDYSDFETFKKYNKILRKTVKNPFDSRTANYVFKEIVNHKIGCSYHWNIYHNGAFTNLIESTKRKRSSSFETSDEISSDSDHNSSIRRVTFPDITQTNQLNDKQLIENTNDTSPAQNNVFSSFDDLSSSHKQKSKPIESSPDHLNDVSGRKELEQINENVILLNELLDDCQTSDDDVYDQIENEALVLMLQCDELIDVSPAVKSARRQTIHNIQEILNKIDCKVTLQKSQTNGAMYSISV